MWTGKELDTLVLRDREKNKSFMITSLPAELHVLSQKLCIDFKAFSGTIAGFHDNHIYASSSPPAHWWHRTEEGHMWWIELCISYNYGYSRKTTIYPISQEFKMLCSWHDAMGKAGRHVKIQIYYKLDCEPYVTWSVSHIKMHFLVSPSAWMQNTWVFNFPWFFSFFFS